MKKLMISCALLSVCASVQAQSTGTLMFGARMQASAVYNNGNAYAVQNLQARIGYFVSPRVAVGLSLETGLNNNKAVPFGLTLMTRYYTGRKEHQLLKVYAEAGAGLADNMLAHTATIADDMHFSQPQNSLQGTAYTAAGISFFPVPWMAIEAGPEYRYVTGQHPVHRLGAGAGIKFFLGERAFKKTFPNQFQSLY
ncbi:MAG: hypothetical protein JNL13_01550 [Chitinophagaceae bacterium]|nr:hypothetical protein [Chitinophagaceae bacterium]